MNVDDTLLWLRSEIAAASDPEFQAGQNWFFQGTAKPQGVRSPDLHRIVRDLYRRVKSCPLADRNKLCTALWKSGGLEEGAIVCHFYRRFASHCAECEFRLFERWLDRYVANWAHCDGLSSWLFSACLANKPELIVELPAWTRSPNRWRRRAAAVSLLQEAKSGQNLKAILDIANRLAEDRDDMVEKGIGWLLKETYPKQPEAVVAFLAANSSRFSRLTLRYAAEKMSASDRHLVLQRSP